MMLFASQVANGNEVILAKAYSYSLGLSPSSPPLLFVEDDLSQETTAAPIMMAAAKNINVLFMLFVCLNC